MSTRRTWLGLVLIAIVVLVVGTTGTAQAWTPARPGVSAAALPRLGSEIVVSEIDNQQWNPAVAYNWKHDEYLVVWQNTWGGGGSDIYAQRVTSTGEVKSWFAVTAGPHRRTQPSVAYDPVNDRYLVVWAYDTFGDGSDSDLWGRLIPWNGPSSSLPEFAICLWNTWQFGPNVAYGRAQEEYLVVWYNQYQTGPLPNYVSGQRIRAGDGGFQGGTLTIANHATEQRWRPDVAYNLARNEYLVVYDSGYDIFGTRLTGNGVKLSGGEFSIAGWPDPENRPAVAACREADQYAVVWSSYRMGDYDLYVRFIRGDGTLESPSPISELAGDQGNADVACDESGQEYLVTWQETLTQTGVSGRMISPNKTMGPGFQIVPPGPPPGHVTPAVGGGESNYLVVWSHQRGTTAFRDIHGRLITPYTAFLPLVRR